MRKHRNTAYIISIFLISFLSLISIAGCTPKEKGNTVPTTQEKTEHQDKENTTEKNSAKENTAKENTAKVDKKKEANTKKDKIIVAETRTLDKYLYYNADIFYEETKELYFELFNCKLKGLYVEEDDQVEKGELLAELDTSELEYQILTKHIDLEKLYLQYDNILNNTGMEAAEKSTALELVELDIEAINMGIAHVEDMINKAKLIAPYDGIVTNVKEIEPGTMVRAFDKLMTINNSKGIILESEILNPYGSPNSIDLSNIITGMKVDLIYGGADKKLYIPATITKIISTDNGIQDNPNRILSAPIPFKLEIKPEGKDADKLNVGRKVVLRINNGTYDNVVVLPKTAIIGSDDNTMIKIVKGDKIINRRVNIGYVDRDNDIVVITSGLLTGESVLSR